MRKFPRAIIDAMRARSVRLALFAEIDHPAGYLRLWTGIGTITVDGNAWIGIGALGGVEGMQSSSEIQIVEHVYTLLNVPPSYEEFVNAKVRGRRAKTSIGFMTASNQVIASLIPIGETTLDVTMMPISDAGEASLRIKGQSDLWQLERPLNVGLSDAEQRKHFPNDTGLSYVVEVTTQRLSWTRV